MKHTLVSTLAFLSLGVHAAESKLELRHREAKGVGYDKGYTSVDYLFLHQWEKPEFLFNLRGHVFNDGRFAGNVGIGYRHGIKDDAYMLGINTFYDCRESKHLFTSQVGAGLEFLSKHLDVRMNGYLPVADKTYEKKRFERFSGNHIMIKQKTIGALPSAEMEFGAALTRTFYLAAGPYYLFKQTVKGVHLGDAWGARLRIDVNIDKYFTLGGLVTYDRIFKTTIQGYLSINIPLGGCWKKREPKRVLRNVPIFRNEIIPLEKKKRHTPLYFGEHDDELVDIHFVNNLAAPGGSGSIEAPFSSLKDAEAASEAGDVIYVFPGDGTPRNMEEGIILKNDQVIASSGAPLELEEITIPPMTPGESPVITNIHPDEPVIINPGDSHLEGFRMIEPWEYFFGDWNFFLGNNNPAAIDHADDIDLAAAPQPGGDYNEDNDSFVIIDNPDSNLHDTAPVIVAPVNDNAASENGDNFLEVEAPYLSEGSDGSWVDLGDQDSVIPGPSGGETVEFNLGRVNIIDDHLGVGEGAGVADFSDGWTDVPDFSEGVTDDDDNIFEDFSFGWTD